MLLSKESDILIPEIRKKIIDEINGEENKTRKAEHFKRHEIYHDRVAKYTEDLLKKQFDESTVEEMKMTLPNVSLCRKIIDKVARVYSYGVDRELPSKREMKKLELLEEILCVNSTMKKSNRYLKLHNNIWVTCLPKPYRDFKGDIEYYNLKLNVLPPYLFDVIEDPDDREKPMVLITSNYDPEQVAARYDAPERTGRRGFNGPSTNAFQKGDRKDQIIADTPNDFDPKNQKYTFWSRNFHFVCDIKGDIVSGPDDFINPIGMIPGIALNKDQDGEYYSIGGSDLVDSCLLVNALIANINSIAIQQGYGQAWMSGKNLPQQLRLGPTKVVKLEASSDGESPQFGFATSNPPLSQLKELIVMQVALLLSTNNLSTSGVKVDLNSGMQFPSGIAMMLDKAESTEEVKDQAQLFLDQEPKLWEVIMAWIDLFNSENLLADDLKDKMVSLDQFRLKINEPQPLISESEKLANLKTRKDLGISTMVDLIKMDDPSLKDEEAERKLLKIVEEKMANMARFVPESPMEEEESELVN